MSNQRSYYQPKFLREMQLGLVVYGGVSLAIYTHGVCQEFYHAVRGRGIYKLVKALTDSDLVVDIISGSSAGGINGILLAYAIANSNDREVVDFSAFARIWRSSGELLKILQKPNLFKAHVDESNSPNESFYQRGLLATLIKGIEHKLPRSPQEWFSPTQELDLAIAGTDYLGKVDRTFTEGSLDFRAKNHRAMFRLKHRKGRKEPFNPYYQDPELPRSSKDTYQALVKLCQITAGTPVIFPLVEVELHNRHNLVDRQLITWGKLAKHYTPDISTRSDKLYFLDGGLLDSTPLTCLMKAAYYRLPNRCGQRKLFYIDPNPEQLNDRLQVTGKKQNRMGQILQAAALSIPIHQSITNDLQTIHEHNHKVRRYHASIDRVESALDSQQILESTDRTQSQIYLRGRLFDFRDRNLPLLLQADLNAQNSQYSVILDKIDRVLTSKFTSGQDRHNYYKLLDRFESQVIDLDVEYSIRQHFYLIETINNLLNSEIDENDRLRLQYLSKQLGCNIKLLEVVRASIELLLSDSSVCNYFYYLIAQESNDRRLRALVYELLFRLHRFLLDGTRFHTFVPNDASGSHLETIPVYFWLDLPELAAENHFSGDSRQRDRWLSQARISSVFAQFKQRISRIGQSSDLHPLIWMDRQLAYDNDRNQSFPSILKQISLAAEVTISKLGDRYADLLLKQWHTFEFIDRELYPFEYLTNLTEKEIISPICISPDTAQLGIGSGKNTKEKLGGDKLYNIGGFFKKSWRSNDLLWGRLDGLNRILEGTITPKSVTAFAGFVRRESTKTNCTPTQYIDWLVSESLPHLSGAERQKIVSHLEYLAQPALKIERAELRQVLADLVLAGQHEILTSDVHSVIEGMDEQTGWWRSPGGNSPTATENWILDKIDLNNTVSSLPTSNPNTIVRIIQQSLANLATQQQHFFRYQYRIGVDKLWENMPLATLISLCTKIVLFLRNLLVKIFRSSSRTQTIRHPLYHWLDGSLQSIYWWLQGGSIKLGTVHRRPRIILLQFVGLITAICGIILAFLLSPLWLLLSLPGAITCWFLQTMRLKRLTGNRSSWFLPQSRES
ncbi:patatin-like protein [Chamaesiphon minutus]|uniref:Patatin-related protein n=1 Tax=Chamaesiphon minutus (strain ATCC 27169 / PCC 6605) TaxID=1173020 RepID=K9UKM4_CHAP6|nr:patatin-like protein [Chamaesiphon minutus]AFY94744.1 patatin-related protein [Chamaesiphon minutus PCC 6605]